MTIPPEDTGRPAQDDVVTTDGFGAPLPRHAGRDEITRNLRDNRSARNAPYAEDAAQRLAVNGSRQPRALFIDRLRQREQGLSNETPAIYV
jgi:hypothetical protein